MTADVLVRTEVDERDPGRRLEQLLDSDSAVPLPSAGGEQPDEGCGVVAVSGSVDGCPVIAFCTDATSMGGSLGWAGAARITEAIDEAVRRGCAVVGLWHSGGARLADGVESMDGVGRTFRAITRASGVVPQISVVLGPAAGAAAYGPALTDVIIMSGRGRVFVTGPDVVRSVTSEDIDMEGLGGTDAHGRRSGVVHITAESESDALCQARRLVGLLGRPGALDLTATATDRDVAEHLPANRRRAYDIRPLIHRVLDSDTAPIELQRAWAPNIVVAIGRLGGRTVGVIANNPMRMGGCLDSLAAEKAARFVRMCDSIGVPLIVLVDVPGYLPGVHEEWGGVVRRGAKLLHAFAEATVPRVTLITRKAYGGAYIAMNSRSLGADAVFAWPDAEIAVMSAVAAVRVLHRKTLAAEADVSRASLEAELVCRHEQEAGGVGRAMSLGVVDDVVEPQHTRRRLAEAIAGLPATRGAHGNIPL